MSDSQPPKRPLPRPTMVPREEPDDPRVEQFKALVEELREGDPSEARLSEETFQALRAGLEAPTIQVRRWAAKALGCSGVAAVADDLVRLTLGDSDPRVQIASVAALGTLGNADALEPLRELLEKSESYGWLCYMGTRRGSIFEQRLSVGTLRIPLIEAIAALGGVKIARYRFALQRALEDDDRKVREAATLALEDYPHSLPDSAEADGP